MKRQTLESTYEATPNQAALLNNPDGISHDVVGFLLRVQQGHISHAHFTRIFSQLAEAIEALHTVFEGTTARVRLQDPRNYILYHETPTRQAISEHLHCGMEPARTCFEAHNFAGQFILLKFHHTVVDGACATILQHEMERLLCGKPPTREITPFSRVAAFQRALTLPPAIREQLHASYAGLEQPRLALGPHRPDPAQREGVATTLQLSPDHQQALKHLVRTHRSTPHTILLALLGIAIGQYHRTRNFVLYSTFANRKRFPDTFGYLANTLPVPIRLETPLGDYFRDVRNKLLLLHRTCEVPASALARATNAPIPHPRIPVLLDTPALDYSHTGHARSPDLELAWDPHIRSPMSALLEVQYQPAHNTISFRFANQAAQRQIEDFAHHLGELILYAPRHTGMPAQLGLRKPRLAPSAPDTRDIHWASHASVVQGGQRTPLEQWLQQTPDHTTHLISTAHTPDAVRCMLHAFRKRTPWCFIDPAWPPRRQAQVRTAFERWRNNPAIACVLFTSGTTGQPKAVAITRTGLLNQLHALDKRLPENWKSFALLARLTFDASLEQVFLPLMRGGTLHLNETPTLPAPDKLRELMREIDVVDATPSLLRTLLEVNTFTPGSAKPGAFLLGGEILEPDLRTRIRAILPHARIWNSYGPTEATINVLVDDVTTASPIPLGTPLTGYAAAVIDETGLEVPCGGLGALAVAGAGIAASECSPSGIYRTGDLVRATPDEHFFFFGRKDRQIKLRGIRLDPGEIEGALADHPAVARAHVFLEPEGRLTLLVDPAVTANAQPWTAYANEIRAHLASQLPRDILPDAIRPMPPCPPDTSGKSDIRRAEATPPFLQLIQNVAALPALPHWSDRLLDITDSLAGLKVLHTAAEAGWLLPGDLLFNSTLEATWNARMHPEPTPADGKPNWQAPARETTSILLTGATGYLGIHLARELLDNNPRIKLAVTPGRANDPGTLERTWNAYFPDIPYPAQRITLLTSPLDETSVPAGIDAVMHAAAETRLFEATDTLHRTNVETTLRLWDQCRQRKMVFHHISTLSVLSAHAMTTPYVKSKWHAEEQLGQQQNLRVYRIGQLAPRSYDQTFRLNQPEHDGLYIAWREAQHRPATFAIEVTPVDLAAHALRLLMEGADLGLYHIFNPHPVALGATPAQGPDAAPSTPESPIFRQLREHPCSRQTLAELNRLGFAWPRPQSDVPRFGGPTTGSVASQGLVNRCAFRSSFDI